MVDYDARQRSFVNQVFQTGKFPVDPEVSKGVYKVLAMDDGSSRLTIDVYFRMKPAFMGGLMKGKMRRLMEDYLIGIEHYLQTGEKVQKKGFKKLRHQYS